MSPRHHTDSFLTDHFFPTHYRNNMTEHHGIPPNSNTSSYLSIYSNLLTPRDHPTNSFVAVNNFPTHFLLNVREHHGIASVVFPWCLLGVPWDPFTKEHQGGTPRNTRGFRFCSVALLHLSIASATSAFIPSMRYHLYQRKSITKNKPFF
jgi:hypothetical protein